MSTEIPIETIIQLSKCHRGSLLLRSENIIQTIIGPSLHSNEEKSLVKALQCVQNLALVDRDAVVDLGIFGYHHRLMSLTSNPKVLHDGETTIAEIASETLGNILAAGCAFPVPKSLDLIPTQLPFVFKFITAQDENIKISVRIDKSRMHSQDDVGQVLWPAAAYFSQWALLHPDIWKQKRVLEIGSGVGLAGLALCHVAEYVCLTDFMPLVLRNLEYNVQLNAEVPTELEYRLESSFSALPDPINTTNSPQVRFLDWSDVSIGTSKTASRPLESTKFLQTLAHWTKDSDGILQSEEDIADEKTDYTSEACSSSVSTLDATERFDVIIGTDMICCSADVGGAIRCLRQWLTYPDGVAYFALPPEEVRWGIKIFEQSLTNAGFSVSSTRLMDDLTSYDLPIHTWEACSTAGGYAERLKLWIVRWNTSDNIQSS